MIGFEYVNNGSNQQDCDKEDCQELEKIHLVVSILYNKKSKME